MRKSLVTMAAVVAALAANTADIDYNEVSFLNVGAIE